MPSSALDLLLRVDATPWDWTVATLPALAHQLRTLPPAPTPTGHVLTDPEGTTLTIEVDRDGTPERAVTPCPATVIDATREAAALLGAYRTARRGDTLARWWPLGSGRRLEFAASPAGMAFHLVRPDLPPPGWAPLEQLCDAAADLAVRVVEGGYVPVEDESLPDMAAALGGRLAWSDTARTTRHVDLAGPPFRLDLVAASTSDDGLVWYPELQVTLYGAGDLPGVPRAVSYDLASAALARRWGAETRTGLETRFWERPHGWTAAVDRSDGVVRIRVRPPDAPPVRPPD